MTETDAFIVAGTDGSPGARPAVCWAATAAARLVVVGSHGRGGVSGTLPGSVGLQLLHHAGCPVLIARG